MHISKFGPNASATSWEQICPHGNAGPRLHLISWSRDSDSIALLEQVKFTSDKQNNTKQPKIKV